MFSWYYIEGILIQSCYTLLIVLGLSILTGYTGMFSFGHAGFVCIGAYVSILCTMAFGLPYWLSLIIAGLAAMLLGAGLGKITLNLKGDYFCIATLGVGEAIRLIFNNLQLTINVGGKDFLLDGAKGVASIPLHTTFAGSLVIVVIFLTATALLMNSKHGRSMLAVREDDLAAQMSGINTLRSTLLAMCMAEPYGPEASEKYAADPESMAFNCYFRGGVDRFVMDGHTISGLDAQGNEVFSHTYHKLDEENENGFLFYQSDDADSGDFTYFAFSPDTMETTYHLEFRYAEDLSDLQSWFEGNYAYWNAAAIAVDYDQETMKNVIELFATENLTEAE